MLGDFPHDGFADLQFHKMIAETAPYDMSHFIQYGIVPVIQAFGSPYVICPQRAYIFESAVGKGGIIFCRLKIEPENPAALYLLSAILKYAESMSCCPKKEITIEALQIFIGNE